MKLEFHKFILGLAVIITFVFIIIYLEPIQTLEIIRSENEIKTSEEISKHKFQQTKAENYIAFSLKKEKKEVLEEHIKVKNSKQVGMDIRSKHGKKIVVCIDPGHQMTGNYDKEPIAPNSKELKAKVSSGTTGILTKVPEYEINLIVSLLLKEKLEKKGYTVVMTRETNNVDISNAERAQIANSNNSDIFLRIHANGSQYKEANGILILCPSKSNRYTKEIYERSNLLANLLINELTESTGANSLGIVYRDDITGFNWSEVPVVLIEMGFLTNPEEDKKLSSIIYQEKIVEGIIRGIEEFYESNNKIDNINKLKY